MSFRTLQFSFTFSLPLSFLCTGHSSIHIYQVHELFLDTTPLVTKFLRSLDVSVHGSPFLCHGTTMPPCCLNLFCFHTHWIFSCILWFLHSHCATGFVLHVLSLYQGLPFPPRWFCCTFVLPLQFTAVLPLRFLLFCLFIVFVCTHWTHLCSHGPAAFTCISHRHVWFGHISLHV